MPRKSHKHEKLNPHLTRKMGKKLDKSAKAELMQKVRNLMDSYTNCYVFDVENYRNDTMKELKKLVSRGVLDGSARSASSSAGGSPSRRVIQNQFYNGRVSLTLKSLGIDESSAYKSNTHCVSICLSSVASGSHKGLLFSNEMPQSDFIRYFNDPECGYQVPSYAKSGFVATESFKVPAGILPSDQFSFSQEYQLRRLGLPVLLVKGELKLDNDYWVCKRGQALKPEQCKLLELFDQKQAYFRVNLHGCWSNGVWTNIDGARKRREADDASAFLDDGEDEDAKELEQSGISEEDRKLIAKSTAFFQSLSKSKMDDSFFLNSDNDDDDDDSDVDMN